MTPQVWIMETGEDSEGGRIIGVYEDPKLAYGDFVAQVLGMTGAVNEVLPEDGGLYVHVGMCDWLRLAPHPVTTAPQHPGSPRMGGPVAAIEAITGRRS
jgi:hypothetical protein